MKEIIEFITGKEIISSAIYVAVGFVIYFVLKKVLEKLIIKRAKTPRAKKKAITIKTLLQNILKYLIVIFVILAVLSAFGINVQSALAGLGIVGIVVGLALQDILKDLLSGITIITEDQFEIGDIIQVGTFKGEVIFLGLRMTRIKDDMGNVKVLANRTIGEVINYSIKKTKSMITISVELTKDQTEVQKEVVKALKLIQKEVRFMLQLDGISEISKTTVSYVISMEIVPTHQLETERLVREKLFDHLNKSLTINSIK